MGNESKPSGSFVVNVDTTPPTAKATLSAIGTDTGTSSSDFVTSDRTLVATVTVDKAMEPGATVQISLDNGRTWNKASPVGGDTYQFDTTATALADGSHTFLARVVDAAGNAGSPTSQVIVIDTSAPTADNAVAITAYIDDVAPNTGEYGTGTSTNDTTPTLKGTVSGLKTGDVVQIYEGTTLLGTATVSGSAWTFATPALADGSTHSYTAAIADAAGNRGTASGAFSLTVDTTVPTQAVTIVSYTDDIGTNRGDFASGTSTDDTAPVLNGKLSEAIGATDVVRIYEGTTLLGTATVTGTSWTFAVPALASGSTHSYTAAIADAAGNVGAASPTFTLTVDTTPPAQSVTITAYTDDVGTNRGDFASGTTTDDMTPLLRGTLSEAIGATDAVRIYEGTALLGTATVTGTSWTFATPALANGSTHTYKAVVADAAGNQGAASSAFTLTVSTSAPAQTTTITAYTDNVGPIQGDFASGTSTDDTTPVLRGELGTAIGATDSVRIYEGTTLLGTATVTGTRWSFATSTLAEGSTHSYMAVVADAAGNEGAPSSRFTLTVDTTAPTQAVAITSYLDNQDPQQGTFASGSKTNDTTPQLNGTLAGTLGAGEVVALYRDGVRLGAATMTGAATWTFQDTGLVDGTSYSYTARVEDAAGNRGGASAVFTLVVDQSAPSAAPSIDSITDDVTPVTGPITSGSTTNDTRPELKGSGAEPNGTVRIYDSGRLIGTATADVTGTWSFTPAAGSELSNGAHSLTVSNVDTAGNEGPKSVPVTFTVDTVAPTTPPSIDSVTDDVAPVVGPITAGSTTNDARPELKGTGAEPNGTVRVYDNGALIGSATADGTGKWSFTPEMGKELANGAHSLAVSSVDAAGNEGQKSAPLAFTVDTVAPTAAPSIDALIDDTEPVTGPVPPGGTTNDTRPELKGAGAEPNGIVRVYDNGALIGSATADAAGKWSFTPEAGKELANGAHSLAASNVDAAGNEGPKSAPTAFTVVTVAPTGAPSIDSVTDDVAPVTGPIVSGSTTNDTRPELKGSGAQPNGTVRIYDNGALIGSATADASGKWSFTPEAGKELANGAHSLAVSNVDAAGNEGPKSTPLAFTVDTVVPTTTPSIDSVTDDVAPVTGPITSGGTTNDARPELKGSGAEPNGTVRVYDNGALIGTAAADASGKWSFTPEAGKELANGAHSLAASNIDAAGNEGPKSAPLAFTVDTVAPSTAPSIDSVTDDVAPVTGPIISGGTTNDARPELKGSGAEPNGTVRIYDNGALIGTATADASGKWSFTPEAGKELANGAHSLTTSNVDAAGNEGPKSAPLAFAVDTVAPSSAPSIDSLMDSVAPVTGPIASGGTTNETRPVLTGAGAEPNGTVRIYDNGTLIGSASADGAGNWSFTPEAGKELANGAHSLTTSNVDAAGNEGPKSAPLAFTVDTVPPPVATLSLGNYSDSFAAAGTLAPNQSSDRYSNDNTFDLVLPGADTLAASYEVSTDGGTVWRATTAAQSNLSDGKYLFRATLTDAAGNSTAAANVVAVTVDRTAPGLDLQRVGGSLVAGKTEAGALVAIDVGNNGSVEASVTADADGNWTWTPSTSIAADTVVSAVAYDLAGNASSKGSQAADTTPPEVTIQKSDGTRFSGTTSDADTPTASPTATKPITVTLSVDKNADGVIDYVLPFTATVTADGAWSIDASSAPVNVGAIVTAVARDYNGNASAPAVVTVGGGTSRISGTTRSDNFGYDVQAIGDFNGDGYNDFAVVAPHGSSAERSANKWSVNILYGSKQGLPDLSSVSNLPGTDGLKIFTSGDISDSNILTAVQGYGDVNGDGYSDVILYDDNLNSAWVIFGRSSEGAGSAPVNVDVRTIISSGGDSNGVAIVQREGGSTWFGAAGALVDVNGDGYADIIMQDWQRGTGSSGTAILYGHAGAAGSAAWSNYYVGFTGSSPASYVSDNRNSSAESTRPHTIIYNDNTNGYPTNVMNIGDINGDGYADFAYGMYNARNPAGNIENAGAIQVIYGTSKGFPQDYSLQTDYTNISNGFRVYGEQANQYLGTYIDPEPYGYLSNTGMPISSGDVNGDGIADMIIGSPQFGPDAGEQRGPGRVYVVYGKAGGAKLNVDLANLSSADGFVITASDGTADAMFGNGTSVGDFNGDGIDDIAIGAPLADVGGKVNNGAVYILYGRQGGYSGIQSVTAKYLGGQSANTADSNYRQNGDANSGSMLGVNVALSDLNGDGQADLALGSAYRGTPGAPATGHLEVVYADAFNFTNLLTVGDDVIAATAGRDRLAGGAGDDVITGVRSGDSAYGGAGNDRIHIEEINGVVRVDGGLGIDTLVVDGSNITLDLSQLGLKVKGFENFDLGRSAANVGNILKLRISDVLNQQSSTGNGNGLGQGHLRVTGDSSDTVELLRDTDSWQNTGTRNVGGVNYDVYHNNTLPPDNTLGDIWIQQGVTVIVNSGGNQAVPAQTVAITSFTDNQDPVQGTFLSGSTTNDATPLLNGTLAGTLGAHEVVGVYRDGTRLGAATLTGATAWTFQDSGLADGATYTYTARVENAVSNRGGAWSAFTMTVDLTPPTTSTSITSYTDDAGASQGNFGSGTTTDDTDPVLNGTLTAALASGEAVRIYEGANLLGTATVSGTTWTYTLGNLADGSTHVYRAVVADAAGGEGTPSNNFTLTADYAVTVNSQVTVDTTPLVTGAMPFKLGKGEYIEVTIDGKTYSSANGAVVVDSLHSTWYVQVPSALKVATYDVQAVVRSASGVSIVSDETSGELVVSKEPDVVVGSASSDAQQKGTAYTVGENGMWRIHSNQSMLDANGTNRATLGSFKLTALKSNTREPFFAVDHNPTYAGNNFVQNATFMDVNRDGHMDLFAVDSTAYDGQQAFLFNGSSYTALQVGGRDYDYKEKTFGPVGGDSNVQVSFGGLVAFDKTGTGFVGVAYGDQPSEDRGVVGMGGSHIVLNPDGNIRSMAKDPSYTDGDAVGGTTGSARSTNRGNALPDRELSGVDLNNDGTIDLVYHASANLTKIGGPSADPNVEATPTSYNLRRLVVASNKGDGTWENTQIIDNVFQNAANKYPFHGNGISMTWADFNGDGYMDLFLGRGYGKTSNEQYQSRILFNDGRGNLEMSDPNRDKIGTTPSSMYTFGGNDGDRLLQGGPSLAVDWNADGKMDAIELPGFSHLDGTTEAGNTGPINLYTNKSSGKNIEFGRSNLLGDANTIGYWHTYGNVPSDAVTGAIAADIDWDGDRDLLAFTQQGNSRLITNTTPVADGTSLHFRILDAQGINALYGNTVQLFNSSGKLVSTQIINPQSGSQTNDSSAIVDFYGLDAKETYTLAILRIENGLAADVGGLKTLGANFIENVNAAWTGLKAGEANHAFVLTTESDTSFASANIAGGIVGTGYNDTFFATQGYDKYEGGGGTVTVSGVKAWSNTGGLDIVDYKLAGNTPLTINLSITGAQDTGFGTATFRNIEGLAGSRGSDTFTDNAADNQFEGRGGNDTFNLTGGGRDTLLYKLLSASDATGGNGADTVNRFEVGTFEATPNADRIDLKELLVGYTADADGAARYINGVAVIDSDDAIGNYLSVTVSGGNTTLSIDRDGSGSAYSATTLITLNGVTTDLATLLANHQIVLV
ncbi:Ig-like domain-containing protein [Variovorax paradoxus]|uniref:Ig-like domain-containing protein n=1 Tax=Variovorax paradoxus TaxID=34073 RepID=UPI001C12BA1A|nr:Ig-like domain-containing protein [Variovorax paradoxus]